MKKLDPREISSALIDMAYYQIELINEHFIPEKRLYDDISERMQRKSGYVVLYGIKKLLSDHNLNKEVGREKIYELYHKAFKESIGRLNFASFCVTSRESALAMLDVDGYNVNLNFSHDGKVTGRSFITTKCIHFDTATPFTANIYGFNTNIAGGYPIISDTRKFCEDKNIDPRDLVVNIPDNYNIGIKPKYYSELLNDYTFGLKHDFTDDMAMVMLTNEIQYGVAHGATDPYKIDNNKPGYRPIRHFEYQYKVETHYDEWLAHYEIPLSEIRDYDGKINLSLAYYNQAIDFSNNMVEVA